MFPTAPCFCQSVRDPISFSRSQRKPDRNTTSHIYVKHVCKKTRFTKIPLIDKRICLHDLTPIRDHIISLTLQIELSKHIHTRHLPSAANYPTTFVVPHHTTRIKEDTPITIHLIETMFWPNPLISNQLPRVVECRISTSI
ncbi:hypothetical protein AAHE18_20G062800 [Arachis hypogaea]